jgi:hypothetical protein
MGGGLGGGTGSPRVALGRTIGGGLVPSFGPRTIVKELLVGCFYFIFIDRKLEVY